MSDKRLQLVELVLLDGAKAPARLGFSPGLNLIIGASDTGKTFVFQAIDHMLGASGSLRQIPESSGYDTVQLSIDPTDLPPVTLQRAFAGGAVKATEYANGREAQPTRTKSLSVVHSDNTDKSLSAYLLHAIGLEGRQVRKNLQGEKQALSFRSFAHLVLVSEERIIQQSSPVRKGIVTSKTADENAFAFFLTGADDSAVIAFQAPQERNTRLVVQEELISSFLVGKRAELAALKLGDIDLLEEAEKLDGAIQDATKAVVASQEQIHGLESDRDRLSELRTADESRLVFVREQLTRLSLLEEYYKTDHARLETQVEASRVFHTLPEGTCPFCSRPYDATDQPPGHIPFEAACAAEMGKIDALRADLGLAISDFRRETVALELRLTATREQLAEVERELARMLTPSVVPTEKDVELLVGARLHIAEAQALQAAILDFDSRLNDIAAAQIFAPPKQGFEKRSTTSVATEFCEVVERLLASWKYPNLGRVTLDTQKADIVIGGQDRANKGKGYRAIAFAAFAIGLMRYCRQRGIPHPGFVVLDSPLNPFKGPTREVGEVVTDEVKEAFFETLALDTSGDQVVVIENEDAPAHVQSIANYHRFSGNPDVGRYGLFPRS